MAIEGNSRKSVISLEADASIKAYSIVKFDDADDLAIPAAAATDLLLGVADIPVAYTDTTTVIADGERVDIIIDGIAEVRAGGTVARGAWVTSDSAGEAVAAAPSAGVNNQVIGRALRSAVDGDIFPIQLLPHQIQGA